MSALILLAFLCLLSSTIWHAVLKAWPAVLMCAGLTLWLVASLHVITDISP